MRLRSLTERFLRDQDGNALVFVAIMLPVLVGFALLAIDMSRANSLHNDMQSGADAFALAAAAELDGNSDAITRANLAIANLITSNSTKFSTADNHTLVASDLTVTYLTSIPASDSTSLSAAGVGGNGVNYATTDPTLAQFAEVTVNPTAFATIFPASFLGSSDSFNLQTQAVAGFSGIVTCNMTPVFICDPFKNADGTGPGFTQAIESGRYLGHSVTLLTKGSSWGPGNFGFLRPSNAQGYGDSNLSADLARGTVSQCVNSRHLYTSTGNLTTNDIAGLNTRFDMFANGGGFPAKTDATWPAAPNVRKGYDATNGKGKGGNACTATLSTDPTRFMGLPTDSGIDSTVQSGVVGNGAWASSYSTYLQVNQMTNTVGTHFRDASGNLYTNAHPPSRYDLYVYEAKNPDGLSPPPLTQKSLGGEMGAPQCTSNISTDTNRRLIYGAIVDCSDPTNLAALNGASGSTLKAEGFGSFFLLSPVVDRIVTEAVDVTGVAGRGTMANFARDNVQLYR